MDTVTGTIDIQRTFDSLPGQEAEASHTMAGQSVRMVAFSGTGGWHKHDSASETVIVWSGRFDVEYRDRTVHLTQGQCTVIAPGLEHRGASAAGARIVLVRTADAG